MLPRPDKLPIASGRQRGDGFASECRTVEAPRPDGTRRAAIRLFTRIVRPVVRRPTRVGVA